MYRSRSFESSGSSNGAWSLWPTAALQAVQAGFVAAAPPAEGGSPYSPAPESEADTWSPPPFAVGAEGMLSDAGCALPTNRCNTEHNTHSSNHFCFATIAVGTYCV
jgi:hypothetical protein